MSFWRYGEHILRGGGGYVSKTLYQTTLYLQQFPNDNVQKRHSNSEQNILRKHSSVVNKFNAARKTKVWVERNIIPVVWIKHNNYWDDRKKPAKQCTDYKW